MEAKKKSIGTWIMWVLIGSAVAYLLYYLFTWKNGKTDTEITDLGTGTTPNYSQSMTDVIDPNKVLKKGDRGNNVVALQKALNDKNTELNAGEISLVPDGVFGTSTESVTQGLTQGRYASDKYNITINAIKNYHV